MLFENLVLKRVIMHEVFKRAENREVIQPEYSPALESLPAKARDQFQLRVLDALSPKSKCIPMNVLVVNADSFVSIAQELVDADDDAFVVLSRKVPSKLADAQMARGIPGGMVVVFDGEIGTPAKRFLGVIKAELHSGFNRTGQSKTQFLDKLFLSPATRLYKVGMVIEENPGEAPATAWSAHVFDHNIGASHRENAAQYFYEAFLGCGFREDGAHETARFFDLAKDLSVIKVFETREAVI